MHHSCWVTWTIWETELSLNSLRITQMQKLMILYRILIHQIISVFRKNVWLPVTHQASFVKCQTVYVEFINHMEKYAMPDGCQRTEKQFHLHPYLVKHYHENRKLQEYMLETEMYKKIKAPSYQYMYKDSHYKDRVVLYLSFLMGILIHEKMVFILKWGPDFWSPAAITVPMQCFVSCYIDHKHDKGKIKASFWRLDAKVTPLLLF